KSPYPRGPRQCYSFVPQLWGGMSESQYKFAEFQLDCANFELRRQRRAQKSERISLERIPMELLILLLERQGSVVTRQEIVDRLWGKDVFVDTEHGINTAIRKVRQALKDDPDNPRFVHTVSGKGYRFVTEKNGQPEFFKDEAELRALWSAPDTRKILLQGLAEKGFGHEQLAEMQRIIDAEKSDLFDVLAYVAYAMPPLTREERAARAKVAISKRFSSKQQSFLNFVLAHYVGEGVGELDQEKLTPLLHLRYFNSTADAIADLGEPEEIRTVFVGFQKYLYQPVA